MLVMEKILEIYWDATYSGVPVLETGRFSYYEYNTGRVDGLPKTDTRWTVSPRFCVATRMTLQE